MDSVALESVRLSMCIRPGTPLVQECPLPDDVGGCISRLRSGEVFVDIGANIGWFTVAAALRVGAAGRVYSFEPSSTYSRLLIQNVQANDAGPRVQLVRGAVGARKGSATLVHSGWTGSTAGFYTDGSPETHWDPQVNRLLADRLKTGVYIYSTGGSARELFQFLRSDPSHNILGFMDTYAKSGGTLEGLPVYNLLDGFRPRPGSTVLITGMFRWEIERWVREHGMIPGQDYLQIATLGPVEIVPQITLDSFVSERGMDRLDFIKIDVDGGEADVLEGAAQVLSRFRPRLYIEVSRYRNNLERVWDALTGLGYGIRDDTGARRLGSLGEYTGYVGEALNRNIFAESPGFPRGN
ncbi:MAG: FkbM family methyltransferase [Nitrospirae bacterium]|nr:FkbM family methyltransferase [Nitrospirota bacterium]